ncbi:low-density lipoprotein receptor-related protein 11-like [Teleopsis dalmanni]|uniref:low-density lipoprotein receptor-related protein 11-like n=1 Tax=Teleopsis dalmanni TaxID=139649 RepID=UPI0018CDFF45|nr:low-density lipoprotein receptor-related protein 11-like [Teleopsis dalmanni]
MCGLTKIIVIMFLITITKFLLIDADHTMRAANLLTLTAFGSLFWSRIGAVDTRQHYDNSIQSANAHHLAKRMDLESCLGQFDVHKNTIIRTGESQAIGGKYLQGLELDTMEECQRLCCETDSCDVYIFEDKNDGYCYLFECGPPENFHCKFTRHANYTSAVLTTIRHIPETTTPRPTLPHIATTNISQQEWELSNLKVKQETREKTSENVPGNGGVVSSPIGTSNTVGTNNIAAGSNSIVAVLPQSNSQNEISNTQKVTNITANCGRFQFSCHSGECIAVYNACDGIPQCEDGSDEGPECSGATSSSSAVNAAIPATNTAPQTNGNLDTSTITNNNNNILDPVVYSFDINAQIEQLLVA